MNLSPLSSEVLGYLYQAMASKFGIVLRTDNIPVLRARLYKARAESGDEDLSCLQFRPDPAEPTSLLWIIKGEKKDASSKE
jgi:hypothetical protein